VDGQFSFDIKKQKNVGTLKNFLTTNLSPNKNRVISASKRNE